MTYHLSRITNWEQNQSVAHYATHNIRQIVSPVLAEFVNLHIYILSGKKDFLLNLLQCFSALTNVWLVYVIAGKIGCEKTYAGLAAFLFYTCPIAFGEALSTQVDQFATLWMLIFLYRYLDVLDAQYKFQWSKKCISDCLIMGGCMAFGYLTKPSVSIGMAFFAFILLIECIRRNESVKIILKLLIGVILETGLLLMPEMLRNFHSFAALSLPIAGQRQLVGTVKPTYVLINGLKNYSFNLPTVYFEKCGHYVTALVYRLAKLLNVVIDAPEIAEDGRIFALHEFRTYGHDTAVNDVIAWSFIFCLIWEIYRFRNQKKQEGRFYVFLVAGAFILLCCVVRWEPFVSRYMLPYLAMLCPAIVYVVEDFREYSGWKKIATWPEVLLIFMCCVDLIGLIDYHRQVSLLGSEDKFRGYFYHQNYLYVDYQEVCDLLSQNVDNIGLILGGDTYEYPLWKRLEDSGVVLRHVMVSNESSKYEDTDFIPAYIISSFVFEDGLEYHDNQYHLHEECVDNSYLWLYQLE